MNRLMIVDDALIMRYYDLNLRAGTREATLTRFSQGSNDESHDITSIKMPALIMWGEQDALIPFSVAAQFESALPQAETAYFAELGHVPMEEAPDKTATALLAFLSTTFGITE